MRSGINWRINMNDMDLDKGVTTLMNRKTLAPLIFNCPTDTTNFATKTFIKNKLGRSGPNMLEVSINRQPKFTCSVGTILEYLSYPKSNKTYTVFYQHSAKDLAFETEEECKIIEKNKDKFSFNSSPIIQKNNIITDMHTDEMGAIVYARLSSLVPVIKIWVVLPFSLMSAQLRDDIEKMRNENWSMEAQLMFFYNVKVVSLQSSYKNRVW